MTRKTTEEDVINKYFKNTVIFNIVCLAIIFLIIIVFFNDYRFILISSLFGIAVVYIASLQTDIFICEERNIDKKIKNKYNIR